MLSTRNTSKLLYHFLVGCLLFLNCLQGTAQDSLKKTPLIRLFETNIRLGLGSPGSPEPTLESVAAHTSHKDYVSGSFVAGYSDTVYTGRFKEWFGSNIASELGFGTSFQFTERTSKLLKRVKPRLGFYHSALNLFSYQMGIEQHHITDTLHFVNPNYPPVFVDSSTSGNITYNYKSKRFYAEVGANVDLVVSKVFILYTGFIYGYGLGYYNTFRVTKSEGDVFVDKTFHEALSYSSRVLFPLGVQVRFGKKKKISSSFLAELRVGSEMNRIHTHTFQSGTFFTLNAGYRIYFNHFK